MTIREAYFNGYISCRALSSIELTVNYLLNGIEYEEIENMDIFKAIAIPNFIDILWKKKFGGLQVIKEIEYLKNIRA